MKFRKTLPLILILLLLLLPGCQSFAPLQTVYCLTGVKQEDKDNQTTFLYDTFGNLLEYRLGGQLIWQYIYDSQGNKLSFEDLSVGVTYTYAKNGNTLSETRDDFRILYTYDDWNNCTKIDTYYSSGITQETRRTYNGQNQILSEKTYKNGTLCDTMNHSEWDYDSSGNLAAKRIYEGHGLSVQYFYTYDGQGRLISSSQHNSAGIQRELLYAYDQAGNLISEESVEYGSQVKSVNTYVYDSRNNLVERYVTDSLGRDHAWFWRYDEADNILHQTHVDWTGEICSFNWTYDERGNTLTEHLFNEFNGGHFHDIVCVYDEAGQKQSETYYDGSSSTPQQISWIYDENGNVIEIRENGKSIFYTYTAVQVTVSQAERIREEQTRIWRQIGEKDGYLYESYSTILPSLPLYSY